MGSTNDVYIVRLGNSGLKVSKIILGTMQYGLKEWADWVLDEDEAVQHIKYACVRLMVPRSVNLSDTEHRADTMRVFSLLTPLT